MSFIIFTKWKDAAWNIKPNCPAASFIWFIPPARKPASKEASTECARNPINYGDFNQFWKIGKHIDPFWHSLHCSLFFVSSAFERRGKRPNEIFPKSPKFYFSTSVTRLDNFWKFLTINFLTKVVPTIWWLLDYFEKHQFCSKNCGDYFLGNILGKLGYFVFQHLVTLTANYNLAFKCRTNVLLQNCSLLLYLTVNWKTIIRWFLTSSKIFAKKLFIKLICH